MLHTGGGLEHWTQESGGEFTRWDLWYLVLLFDDYGGSWEALADTMEKTLAEGMHSFKQLDFEAKRGHMENLRHRLNEAGLDPARLVGDLVRDKRILRKARTKILKDYVRDSDKTVEMRTTPRYVLEERAWRGEWGRFPVSPAVFEPVFQDEVGRRSFYSEDASSGLARRIGAILEKVGRKPASSPEARLALYRAGLAALVDAMEVVDDSCGTVGEMFEEIFEQYVAIPWPSTGIAPGVYYRDFLDFAVWEDYGLTDHGMGRFFAAVPPEHVPLVDTVLLDIRADLLRYKELDYQADQALRLLVEFHTVKRTFDRFVDLAREMGPRHPPRINAMAKAAWDAGEPDLARVVFAAADLPGPRQDCLRKRHGPHA
ncbi:MAG: hypothetical protein M0Z41_10560 [Peptococcaceae bacterium]|nr:hypothetical protein [Peptococcaceae bacterium]